ncbi:hypothetical protein ACJMK2_023376 [Sinanodonta woodiana]|uniref:VWFD domain-containing protein n=1 Tax=Sinanodonta woodiana TaxID=1069815 RepID=A0ABD3T5N2_SINWO
MRFVDRKQHLNYHSIFSFQNWDPEVREDMEMFLTKLIPESTPFKHSCEGPDDMPAHIKACFLGNSVNVPITDGKLNLGSWQGIWLCEHRNNAVESKNDTECEWLPKVRDENRLPVIHPDVEPSTDIVVSIRSTICHTAGDPVCTYYFHTHNVGDVFMAADGCNKCLCTERGMQCTGKACNASGFAKPKFQELPGECHYRGNDGWYVLGAQWQAVDGCNTCVCLMPGNYQGYYACTTSSCCGGGTAIKDIITG